MQKPEIIVCECCGVASTVSIHHLNQTTVRLMAEILYPGWPSAVEITEALRRAHGMNHSHYTNSTKLQHWGLVAPHITHDNKHRRGWWKITQKGRDFVQGRISLARVAVTVNMKLLRYEGETVFYSELGPDLKMHGDYAEDKRQQILTAEDE